MDKDKIKRNISLKELTSLRLGGKANFFIEVYTIEELRGCLKFAKTFFFLTNKYILITNAANINLYPTKITGSMFFNESLTKKKVLPQIAAEYNNPRSANKDLCLCIEIRNLV